VKAFRDYLVILIGSIIYAAATVFLVFPNSFSFGGSSGVGLILSEFHPLPAATITAIINVLLMALALIILGRQFAIRTLVGSVCTTGCIALFEYLPFLALPVCNLLYAQPVNHDWHVIILLSCAAITEELLFRGVLLEHLPLGHMPALFLSSLAFALLHAANLVSSPVQHVFLQIICAFFFGVCAGAATLLHKSLIPALAAHLLINLTGARTQLPSQTLIVCIAIYTIYGPLLCRRLRDVS